MVRSQSGRRDSAKRKRRRREKRISRRGQRRRILVGQELEKRLLLATDVLDLGVRQSLTDGLHGLVDAHQRIEQSAVLSSPLPLLTQSAGDAAPIPISIGQTLDLDEIVFAAIAAPVQTYLESSLQPTANGVVTAINDALAGADTPQLSLTGTAAEVAPGDPVFGVTFTAMRTIDVQIDFNSELSGSPLTIDDVYATTLDVMYQFDAKFGSRLDDQTGTPDFFVNFGEGNRIAANLGSDSTTDNPDGVALLPALHGSVGFLGIETQPGTASTGKVAGSTIDLDVTLPISFPNQPDGGFDAAELSGTSISQLVAINTTEHANRFSMDLPLTIEHDGLDLGANPGVAEQPRVLISDDALFDGEFSLDPPFFVFENSDQLLDFRTVTSVGIFSAMQGLQEIFDQIRSNEVFQKEIPFTNGKTLGDILDLNAAFGVQVIDKIATQEEQDSSAAFNNVQQFVNLLASRISYVQDDDGDPATHDPAILFDLDFHHRFDVAQFGLDFGFDLGELSNFSTDSDVSVEADLDAQMQIGVLLRRAEGGLPITRETELDNLNGGTGVVNQTI